MQPSCPRDEWVERFSVRIHELRPSVNHGQSLKIAVIAFSNASDIEPEDAAAVIAEILDAGVPLEELNRLLRLGTD